jgi:hypothetical protein
MLRACKDGVARAPHCEMNRKFSSVLIVFLCALAAVAHVRAQGAKPLIFTTTPKPVTAKLATGADEMNLRSTAVLTINAANADDTMTGTLVFIFADEARQQLAQASGQPLKAIPAKFVRKDVSATFRADTACPVLHLDVPASAIEVAGVKLNFARLTLDIYETPAQITQLFCNWTRQINVQRTRRGIVAAINRLLVGEQ